MIEVEGVEGWRGKGFGDENGDTCWKRTMITSRRIMRSQLGKGYG